jgi:tRNA threonylcarbamoyl adenosine modification protein YeaZ
VRNPLTTEDALPGSSPVLGLDTAGPACSVALYDPKTEAVLASLSEPMRKGHAEALLPMVDKALGAAAIAYADIGRVAVTAGPGTFTGTRVGLAAARGIALAAGCPAVGVSGLEVLAYDAIGRDPSGQGAIFVAVDARRGQLYAQTFAADRAPLSEPAAVDIGRALDDLEALAGKGPVRLTGQGADLLEEGLAARRARVHLVPVRIDAVAVARLGALQDAVPGTRPAPLYLRPPDAALPKSAS